MRDLRARHFNFHAGHARISFISGSRKREYPDTNSFDKQKKLDKRLNEISEPENFIIIYAATRIAINSDIRKINNHIQLVLINTANMEIDSVIACKIKLNIKRNVE